MALLAYGFHADSSLLQEKAQWFDRVFPKQENDWVDASEMNRLLMLLHLRPQADDVRYRLEQLVRQKNGDSFDVQPSWSEFDTLWALEIFKVAHQQNVLTDDIIKMDDLCGLLDKLLHKELGRDKDIAVAVRLQKDLVGDLTPAHKKHVRGLIATAQKNGGVWGLEELGWRLGHMDWLKKLVKNNKLTPEEVRPFQQQFRRVILSTCMVIENLVPLADCVPEVEDTLHTALRLWWDQFYGENAVSTLRALFPKPHDYDYIVVLARTMRTLRQYLGRELCTVDTVQVHILNELAEAKVNLSESPDVRHIREALRHWINVDLIGEMEPLKLGFSEANVVRVQPHIWSPMIDDPQVPNSLITQSLIIKYGSRELIKLEQKNYETIPSAVRDCFVRIPEESYQDPESKRTFVIMQDLRDYKTLYEERHRLSDHEDEIADQLTMFLWRMHTGGRGQAQEVSPSLLREIYLRKMMEYVDRIFDFISERELVNNQEMIAETQQGLFHEIGQLIKKHGEIGRFPAAVMHGDLHMRNIMVKGMNPGTNGHLHEMVFRLIDLEYMNALGDAAFDAGQIIMDIDLISREETRFENRTQLQKLGKKITEIYEGFGVTRQDSTFALRIELAKARALLRIAKGKVKRGSQYHKARQSAQAVKIAEDVLVHAMEARELLRKVSDGLGL